jgi:hypothetical protein
MTARLKIFLYYSFYGLLIPRLAYCTVAYAEHILQGVEVTTNTEKPRSRINHGGQYGLRMGYGRFSGRDKRGGKKIGGSQYRKTLDKGQGKSQENVWCEALTQARIRASSHPPVSMSHQSSESMNSP